MKILLLDLDGTLTDPMLGLRRCLEYALAKSGAIWNPASQEEASLRWAVGPPFRQSAQGILGPDQEHLYDEFLKHFRDRYASDGWRENELYPGIHACLDSLRSQGHRLLIATSKSETYVPNVLSHFGIASRVEDYCGATPDGARSEKADVIAELFRRHGLTASDVAMIGDRKYDLIGAKAHSIPGFGVLWGYGTRQELEEHGAVATFDQPSALARYFETKVPIK